MDSFILEHFQLLAYANVMVYIAIEYKDRREHIIDVLRYRFQYQNLSIHVRDNLGYHMRALAFRNTELFKEGEQKLLIY